MFNVQALGRQSLTAYYYYQTVQYFWGKHPGTVIVIQARVIFSFITQTILIIIISGEK